MSKRGKLSKVELSYIENNYPKVEVGELAEDLDRTVDSIKKAVEDMGLNKEEPNEQGVIGTYNGTKAGDFMGRHVRDGRVTVTVMTEAASEHADENKRKPAVVTRHTENALHKPLGRGKYDKQGQFKKNN